MAWVLNPETQQVEEVPEAEATQRVAQGTGVLQKGTVRVVSPKGEVFDIDSAEAPEAFRQGWRMEGSGEAKQREREEKYGDSPVAAGALGLLSGATAGLSRPLLSKAGWGEETESIRELNPKATAVGEVVGAIAPAVVSGGAALPTGAISRGGVALGKALEGAAPTIGRQIASRAIAGAVEGGAYGTLNALSEAAVPGSPEANGEKLLSGIGLGALLGAAGNVAGLGLEKGVGKLLGKGAKRAATEAVEEGAESVTQKATGEVAKEAVEEGAEQAVSAAQAGADQAARPDSPSVFERLKGLTDDIPTDDELGKIAQENAGFIKKTLSGLGLDVPSPEGLVLRDLDLTGAQVAKVKGKGLGISAPRALLDDVRYADAKTLPEKLALIRTKQGEAGEAISAAVSKFDEVADKAAARVDPAAVAARIQDDVLAPMKKGLVPDKAGINRVQEVIDRLDELAGANLEAPIGPGVTRRRPVGSISFREAEELKRGIDPYLKWDSLEPGPAKEALRKVRGILNAEIESKAGAVAKKANLPEAFSDWKKAKALYGQMSELEGKAALRAAAREGNRFFSLTDNIVGAGALAASGLTNPIGMAGGAGAALLNKWGRERLPHILALQFHRMRQNPGLATAAKGFFRAVKTKLDDAASAAAAGARAGEVPTPNVAQRVAGEMGEQAVNAIGGEVAAAMSAPKPFGQYGALLANAVANGADSLWVTHAVLSDADPSYRDEMAKAGFPVETPEQQANMMRQANGLARVSDAVAAQDAKIDAAVARFLGQKPGPTPKREKGPSDRDSRLKAWEERAESLLRLSASPDALLEALKPPPELADAAPALAVATTQAAARAAQFLASKAPRHPNPHVLPALQRPWKPSDNELARWERYVRAVDNPASVLAELRTGAVTKESIEALRAVYPKYLEAIQEKVAERLSAMSGRLPAAQRTALGRLFGDGFDSRRQARLQVIQQAHRAAAVAEAQQQAAQQAAAQGARPPSRPLKLPNNFSTLSQRLEARGAQG